MVYSYICSVLSVSTDYVHKVYASVYIHTVEYPEYPYRVRV